MVQDTALTVICHYKVKPGHNEAMEALLAKHWPALHRQGLVTDDKPLIFRGRPADKPDGQHGAASTYVEIFKWKSPQGPVLAHQTPEVMAIWEPMGALCEAMDFPHFDPLDLPLAEG